MVGVSIGTGRSILRLIAGMEDGDKSDGTEKHTGELDDGLGEEAFDEFNDGIGETTSATELLLAEVIGEVELPGEMMGNEGQFDITSLSRSFVQSESVVTGGLNLTMTRPDGSLFGGVVEGKLSAATPVQVVVRSVFPDMEKLKSKPPASTPPPNKLNWSPAGY
ncbi:hypothetical protein CQW23_18672 [Capsicum baccatum]|uniref:AT-hook motif nuclear-localized protein n=1 Tax=Capsicum baccatum TaxID=33114 RepID=A0A2G2W3M5_CAPBA|nr:hypothetical protein CQW23_18672 [Capsicum baccatum]